MGLAGQTYAEERVVNCNQLTAEIERKQSFFYGLSQNISEMKQEFLKVVHCLTNNDPACLPGYKGPYLSNSINVYERKVRRQVILEQSLNKLKEDYQAYCQ